MTRWAWAEIDLGAIGHNVAIIRDAVAPAGVWAVVKADGYGHGAVAVGRAALAAGADGLCVALTSEGVVLRDAGITAPVLVLSEQPDSDLDELVERDLSATAYTVGYLDALASRRRPGVQVHLKFDTGMRRVGADPSEAAALAVAVTARGPWLELAGVVTHLAVADEPDDPTSDAQLDQFGDVLDSIEAIVGPVPLVHAANSAGALAHPRSRFTLVRAGVAIYGISPGPGVDHLAAGLRPAMTLRARVSFVKRVRAGDRISYGHRHEFDRDTRVATVPIGYADGVPRRLSAVGGEVLIGGRRRPIVGVVTMDQLMVDVGDDPVAVGDEVVLLGSQGHEAIRAEDWAGMLGTIGYEIVCGISARVPRVVRSG